MSTATITLCLKDSLAIYEWQLSEIKADLTETDAGETISYDVVLKKWMASRCLI
ncbi:hypothetical protein BH10PSE19_BH10PSE19_09910 [soil metagenome]